MKTDVKRVTVYFFSKAVFTVFFAVMSLFVVNAQTASSSSSTTHTTSSSGGMKWYKFEQLDSLMKVEPRKIIVDMYTDWCRWCIEMDKKTFTHSEIAKLANEKFYAIKFDAEGQKPVVFNGKTYQPNVSGKSHELAIFIANGKLSYPTLIFMNEKKELLSPVPGYQKPENLEPILVFFGYNYYYILQWEKFNEYFKGKIDADAPVVSSN